MGFYNVLYIPGADSRISELSTVYISQPEPIKSCLVLNAQSRWEQSGLEQTE